MTSVVLADDHPMAREGLRLLVDGHDGVRVVGEAGDTDAALSLVQRLTPDLVTLELGLPGSLSTLDAVGLLVAWSSPTRALVVSSRHEPAFVHAARRAGAAGYVLKDRADELLLRAFTHVTSDAGFFV